MTGDEAASLDSLRGLALGDAFGEQWLAVPPERLAQVVAGLGARAG